MKDFSIGKTSSKSDISSSQKKVSKFTKMKIEYNKFKAQLAKSDFANSPVAVERELELLTKLKELAEKENWQSELGWINEREVALNITKKDEPVSAYYILPNIETPSTYENPTKEKWDALVKSCTLEDGSLDVNAEKLFTVLKEKTDDIYHVASIFSKCRESDGKFNSQKVDAIVQMSQIGINSARMSEFIDELSYFDVESGADVIDFDVLSDVGSFVASGVKDVPALKMAQYLSADFADKSSVKSSLVKMYDAKIDIDSIFKIMDKLSVDNPKTGKIDISPKSVATIAKAKVLMSSTRRNETAERNNPINKLGEKIVSFDGIQIITKDGLVTYSTPVEGENFEALKEKYDELVSSIEDNMLLEFASKYKDAYGEIDTKYIRILSFLREAGIVYNGLFRMMESCIKESGNIDVDKLTAIKTIKKAGALSDDVPMLIGFCSKDEDGNYSQKDIKNICDLTSSVIRGKDVCSLLSIVGQNDDVKQLVMTYGKYFSQNDNLLEILPLLTDKNGQFGENEIEVFDDLAFSFFSDENNFEKSELFLSRAEELMSNARSSNGVLTDDGAGICAIMCQAGEPFENIITALDLCKNNSSDVDEKLAQILWDMYVQDASLAETIEMISVCKSENGDIDYDKANMIIDLFAAKYSKEKIADLVQH